ncbi:response regulator [Shewanella sp. 202IG2-18]|uniref:response regulator n=1 Tax=Parashewanella hymeniacidonis TaxID=2807618 RepID=UPI00195F27E2|nr:response regulator [Parashewanella hymeniacidonis]MBM7072087.1 response regulator [Parashewanella hymeniacidonis]
MALNDVSILFIEQESKFRSNTFEFLSQQGANVSVAEDDSKALSYFKKHRFDLILIDLSSPELNGLELLKSLTDINASIPSIVLSGNSVMTDVVEALRIGASDYLIKPIDDLYVVEHAIQQCLSDKSDDVPSEIVDELAYEEFQSNLEYVEESVEAVNCIQQQLFPAAEINYPAADVCYSLFKKEDISSYLIDSTLVGEQHLLMYMAHFQPEDDRAGFASVLLRSLVNQKLKAFRMGKSQSVIEPFNMMSYLNDRIAKSGLDIFIDMIYVTVDLRSYRTAIAQAGQGLRCYLRNTEGLMPLAISDTLQLGMNNWGKTSTQYRTLNRGEHLCISTSNPEHKPLLLNNQFVGLVQNNEVPSGGYIELRL